MFFLLVATVMVRASKLTGLATRGAQTARNFILRFRCHVCRQLADRRDEDMTVTHGGCNDRHL
ncbi:unnamed protein product (plasmid) [Mycetohabitans rhizoxinica HKI 454]|uniref:Uncharacterized protein n=1 Tax=Mycetohabitans rhizoxinica (strain DSM 19002 / CIP 109453 / HKI 454) TaxID=882378 RepID=E5AUL5_MYCRK|nr:unnamed protein product [Mycetohabitans rhizoxinica HKI 454]